MAETKRPERIKVTVNLPRDLVKAAKVAAIEREIDLQDLIAEALAAAVSKRRAE